MIHGHNNKNRNNNNRRFSKNNNFKKRRFGGGGGNFEEEQQFISPQQRRNFENKRDQHLMKAKEYLAAGERIDAENHFQHADHYHRMAIIGLDKIQQQQAQQQQQQQQYNNQQDQGADAPVDADSEVVTAPAQEAEFEAAPEIPVDMMGRFPSEDQREKKTQDAPRGDRNNRQRGPRPQREARPPRQPQNAAEGQQKEKSMADLPFMQTPIKEA